MYTCIYIERERENNIYIYIYMYVGPYIYRERERYTHPKFNIAPEKCIIPKGNLCLPIFQSSNFAVLLSDKPRSVHVYIYIHIYTYAYIKEYISDSPSKSCPKKSCQLSALSFCTPETGISCGPVVLEKVLLPVPQT